MNSPISLYQQNVSSDLLWFRSRIHEAGADALTVVLTGHLLVEKMVRSTVEINVKSPEYIKKIRFADMIQIGRALGIGESWYWDAAAALNRLRNAYAHELLIEDNVAPKEKQFYEILEKNTEVTVVNESRMAGEILMLYAQFSKLINERFFNQWIENPQAAGVSRVDDGLVLKRRKPD